jgi:hypothetical protein
MSVLLLRIAMARRAVRELTAIAERRAAGAESISSAPSFRPLAEAEAEDLLGADLLAQVAASARRS